jgi:hypothetical protein
MREGAEALTLSILTGHFLKQPVSTPNTYARITTFLPTSDGRKHDGELRNYMKI